MVADGVLVKVVKNSSIIAAKVYTGISIHNDVNLDLTNSSLTTLGHSSKGAHDIELFRIRR